MLRSLSLSLSLPMLCDVTAFNELDIRTQILTVGSTSSAHQLLRGTSFCFPGTGCSFQQILWPSRIYVSVDYDDDDDDYDNCSFASIRCRHLSFKLEAGIHVRVAFVENIAHQQQCFRQLYFLCCGILGETGKPSMSCGAGNPEKQVATTCTVRRREQTMQ